MKPYKTLRIITNFACDQRCKFCYQKRWDENFITVPDIEKQLRKYNIDLKYISDYVDDVTIMGGEPTLLGDGLGDLTYFLRNVIVAGRVNVNTNGHNLLSGMVTHDFIYHLNSLTFDVALGQSDSYEKDVAGMYKKIGKAYDLMSRDKKLIIKFNHIYGDVNKQHFEEYFNNFMQALRCLPQKRVRISVCEDVNSEKFYYNVDMFANMFNLMDMGQKDNYYDLHYGKYRIAYFSQELYNDTDLIVWKDGITNKFSKYLKVVAERNIDTCKIT